MNFTLLRKKIDDTGVYGILVGENGKELCVTLEHNFGGKPAIPRGKYMCTQGHMAHMDLDTYEVTNVPGHTAIFIHRGNTQADSKGCILLGTSFTEGGILQSKLAFDKFISLQAGVISFYLTVVDPGDA